MLYAIIVLSLILLASLYFNYMLFDNMLEVEAPIEINETQSSIIEAMKEHDSSFRDVSEDEETERFDVKVAIYDNNAYWIGDGGGLVTAPVDEDGEVLRSLEKRVDVHALSHKEVSLLMNILDALKEANDEGSGSGN
jgi:hypothetical protein